MAIVLAREDVEVHLHAPETKTKYLLLYEWANSHVEKLHYFWETNSAPGYLMSTQSLAVIGPFRVL